MFAESYREEARKLGGAARRRARPAAAVGPRATTGWCSGWSTSRRGQPRRPWRRRRPRRLPRRARDGGRRAHPGARRAGRSTTSPTSSPTGRRTGTTCARTCPDLPHLEEAAALAARFAEVTGGDDRRAHRRPRRQHPADRPTAGRCSATGTGRCVGAAWLDTLFLLIGPRGDGLDVDAVLAARPADPRRAGRARRHRAGAGDRLLPQQSPTSRCRRPRRTSATPSAGRARSSGTGCASGGAGPVSAGCAPSAPIWAARARRC